MGTERECTSPMAEVQYIAALKDAGIDVASNKHTVLVHFRGSW